MKGLSSTPDPLYFYIYYFSTNYYFDFIDGFLNNFFMIRETKPFLYVGEGRYISIGDQMSLKNRISYEIGVSISFFLICS